MQSSHLKIFLKIKIMQQETFNAEMLWVRGILSEGFKKALI